jgi:hypothetical protein
MTTELPEGLIPRNTVRGRPRASGTVQCARCGRDAGKTRASWPEGKISGPCFTLATRTHGTCLDCGHHRLLPRPPVQDGGPRCAPCAGILHNFHCARCALRDDLTALLLTNPADQTTANRLVDVLCQADRPESIITWKGSAKVQVLLTAVSSGQTPLTHDILDSHRDKAWRAVDHLRALLVHHGLLPHQDPYLSRFEAWIDVKLRPLPAEVAKPVEHFAKWHHLRCIRAMATPDKAVQGPVHAAKQEITETIKFLDWLWLTHNRTASTCTQQDVDTWLTTGPTTRKAIRTFFVFAGKTGTNLRVEIGHYTAEGRPAIQQEQRLAWLRELLTGTSESLPYRVAGTLLLLYAQPIVRVAALRTTRSRSPLARVQCLSHSLSRNSSASISGAAPTSEQAQAPKARGSSPESGQASTCTCTRTRSCFGFAASASTCEAHGTMPWTSTSQQPRHHCSPTHSATATR